MQKNSGNFSIEDMMKLVNIPAGKQLIEILKRSDPQTLQNAAAQASKGDMNTAKDTLAPLMASQTVQELLRQLGG